MENKKIYLGVGIIFLLILSVSFSYAYFSINVSGNDNAKDVVVNAGTLSLVYTDGPEIKVENIRPGKTITKEVTVKNTGTLDTNYNIVWQSLLNEITNDELVLSATCERLNASGVAEGTCNSISQAPISDTTIAKKIAIESGITHKYTFTILFKETNANQNYNQGKKFSGVLGINEYKNTTPEPIYCTYDGELTQGAEYVNGQYTYRYMQEVNESMSGLAWQNITSDGWGVQLTDKASTDAVTSKVCTYINNKPVVSMSYMFSDSKATTIDVSNFDTSKVTYMSHMFAYSQATTLDVSNFDTSNVTDMSYMFRKSKATTLDVSNFDTSKVTDMSYMFYVSQATTLDLSNFNTSNVKNMSCMFGNSQATILDVSSFDTSNVTDMSCMFDFSYSLTTIYVSSKFKTDKVTDSTRMFYDCTKLIGGAGTKYNSSYVDKTYARIDGGTSNPGYFTDVADKPSTFPTDSWKTIAASVKAGNTRRYKVGDTKSVDVGTYGTHTLRIANTSTPSECSTAGFSQSACGFVVEFTDIITTHKMNPAGEYNGTQYNFGHNIGGWPASSMYTFVNNDIYNTLPSDLRNVIIDTLIVSSHGNGDTENFTSTDKLYLLDPKEIYIDFSDSNDTAKDLTRTLDYYTTKGVTINKYNGAIKKNGTNIDEWWLRSAFSIGNTYYYTIGMYTAYETKFASTEVGISPAFRIG